MFSPKIKNSLSKQTTFGELSSICYLPNGDLVCIHSNKKLIGRISFAELSNSLFNSQTTSNQKIMKDVENNQEKEIDSSIIVDDEIQIITSTKSMKANNQSNQQISNFIQTPVFVDFQEISSISIHTETSAGILNWLSIENQNKIQQQHSLKSQNVDEKRTFVFVCDKIRQQIIVFQWNQSFPNELSLHASIVGNNAPSSSLSGFSKAPNLKIIHLPHPIMPISITIEAKSGDFYILHNPPLEPQMIYCFRAGSPPRFLKLLQPPEIYSSISVLLFQPIGNTNSYYVFWLSTNNTNRSSFNATMETTQDRVVQHQLVKIFPNATANGFVQTIQPDASFLGFMSNIPILFLCDRSTKFIHLIRLDTMAVVLTFQTEPQQTPVAICVSPINGSLTITTESGLISIISFDSPIEFAISTSNPFAGGRAVYQVQQQTFIAKNGRPKRQYSTLPATTAQIKKNENNNGGRTVIEAEIDVEGIKMNQNNQFVPHQSISNPVKSPPPTAPLPPPQMIQTKIEQQTQQTQQTQQQISDQFKVTLNTVPNFIPDLQHQMQIQQLKFQFEQQQLQQQKIHEQQLQQQQKMYQYQQQQLIAQQRQFLLQQQQQQQQQQLEREKQPELLKKAPKNKRKLNEADLYVESSSSTSTTTGSVANKKGRKKKQKLEEFVDLTDVPQQSQQANENGMEVESSSSQHPNSESSLITIPKSANILVTYEKVPITVDDLKRLDSNGELNDNIIEFYFRYLYTEILNDEQRMSFHFFNTFWYPSFAKGGYTAISKWTKNVDIFSKRHLFIPIHQGSHWLLLLVILNLEELNPFLEINNSTKSITNINNNNTDTLKQNPNISELTLTNDSTTTTKEPEKFDLTMKESEEPKDEKAEQKVEQKVVEQKVEQKVENFEIVDLKKEEVVKNEQTENKVADIQMNDEKKEEKKEDNVTAQKEQQEQDKTKSDVEMSKPNALKKSNSNEDDDAIMGFSIVASTVDEVSNTSNTTNTTHTTTSVVAQIPVAESLTTTQAVVNEFMPTRFQNSLEFPTQEQWDELDRVNDEDDEDTEGLEDFEIVSSTMPISNFNPKLTKRKNNQPKPPKKQKQPKQPKQPKQKTKRKVVGEDDGSIDLEDEEYVAKKQYKNGKPKKATNTNVGTLTQTREIRKKDKFAEFFVFDSRNVANPPNITTIARIVRGFLNEEWRTKKMDPDDTEAKKFTPRNTPVHACDVPQQPETNEVDCGVYLLHYVEQWLKNPFPPEVITDDWFSWSDIKAKRKQISETIKSKINPEVLMKLESTEKQQAATIEIDSKPTNQTTSETTSETSNTNTKEATNPTNEITNEITNKATETNAETTNSTNSTNPTETETTTTNPTTITETKTETILEPTATTNTQEKFSEKNETQNEQKDQISEQTQSVVIENTQIESENSDPVVTREPIQEATQEKIEPADNSISKKSEIQSEISITSVPLVSEE